MTERVGLPDLDTLDSTALKALILFQHEQLACRDSEIEQLKRLIAKLRRMQFGRKSEKLERQIEQLELRLDELETKRAEQEAGSLTAATVEATAPAPAAKRERRALPAHLPREERRILPKQQSCPDCGSSNLKPLGEDVSEILEYVPAHFKVIRQVRRNWPVGVATRSCRQKRRAGRSHGAWLGQGCCPTCWSRNIAITCRCIGRKRCTGAKA